MHMKSGKKIVMGVAVLAAIVVIGMAVSRVGRAPSSAEPVRPVDETPAGTAAETARRTRPTA